MNFKLCLVIVFLISGISSCVKIIDLPPPVYIPKFVLNGLINPDSILTVSLTKSTPSNNNSNPISITNATIMCYEDGKPLGSMIYQYGSRYQLSYKPKAGKKYKVEAKVPEDITLASETYIPLFPDIQLVLSESKKDNINNNPDINIQSKDIDTTNTRLWFSSYLKIFSQKENIPKNQIQSIESTSPYLDPFNSKRSGYSIKRTWNNYVRIVPEYIRYKHVDTKFNIFNPVRDVDQYGEALNIYLICGSIAFDNYLKSSINAYNNRISDDDGQINNPFAEPLSVYSNVEGGIGIFAGYNAQMFTLIEAK